MIIKSRIKLKSEEKLKYYRVSIILLVIAVFCLFNGLYHLEDSANELNNNSTKARVLLILIGTISFFVKNHNLKLKKLNLPIDEITFKERLEKLIERNRWAVDLKTQDTFVVKTDRNGGGGRFMLSRSYGEMVFITISSNKLYLKSIFDYDKNFGRTVSLGENKWNEKLIANLIE